MADYSTAQRKPVRLSSESKEQIPGLKRTIPEVRPLRDSTPPTKPRAKFNLAVWLRQWHQRAGLFAFFFMAWLGASGVLLNQSASWGLDAIRVKFAPIMAMYGLHPELPENAFYDGEDWLLTTTENSVLNGQLLARQIPSPLGLVSIGGGDGETLYVATDDSLVLFDPQGQRIEEMSGYMLPSGHIRKLGKMTTDGTGYVVIQGENNYASSDGFNWQGVDSDAAIHWSDASAVTPAVRDASLPYARPSVALEQLLIDLHSGRLFGGLGPWVVNAVGVACVFLSVTGFWMYWRVARMRRAKPRKSS